MKRTVKGRIEAEVHGSGKPTLILHGSPGGIDAARAMSHFLPLDRFRIICVSRPGYLDTPLDKEHASIDDEADLLAALLRDFGVRRVGVLAWSGGGPAAYRLAVRHPDLVAGIIAVAACSFRWVAPPVNVAQWLMFGTGIGERVVRHLCRFSPQHVVKGALEGEGSVRGKALDDMAKNVMANQDQAELVLNIAKTVSTAGKRQTGWKNDVANYGRIDSLELERIHCPVLLVHGDADTDADIEHSRYANRQLQNSTLVVMEAGTHLSFYAHPDAPRVQEQAREFLLGSN